MIDYTITTEEEYDAAIALLPTLWDAKPETPEGDALDALVLAIEAYEDEHYSWPLTARDKLGIAIMEFRKAFRSTPEWRWIEKAVARVALTVKSRRW